VLDAAQLLLVKDKLLKIIDPATDSLRFYTLGNNYKSKVEHHGAKPSFDVTEPLII
jgi:CRISPR-associated protein Cas2